MTDDVFSFSIESNEVLRRSQRGGILRLWCVFLDLSRQLRKRKKQSVGLVVEPAMFSQSQCAEPNLVVD